MICSSLLQNHTQRTKRANPATLFSGGWLSETLQGRLRWAFQALLADSIMISGAETNTQQYLIAFPMILSKHFLK